MLWEEYLKHPLHILTGGSVLCQSPELGSHSVVLCYVPCLHAPGLSERLLTICHSVLDNSHLGGYAVASLWKQTLQRSGQ